MQDFIWLNGDILPMSEARLGVEDRGFQFADGVYEVIRLYDGRPFTLREHLDRLQRSAEGISLTVPLDRQKLTAEIVSAYVSNNTVPAGEISSLINQVHAALSRVSGKPAEGPAEPLKPAVSVKKSITPEFIICLEDGKKFKSLKRHLRTHYNLSPEEYREKWGLPHDYPMVAPNYAQARSALAKQMGLGTRREK